MKTIILMLISFLIITECAGKRISSDSTKKQVRQNLIDDAIRNDVSLSVRPVCSQVIEGIRCPVEITIKNEIGDLILILSIKTNRSADGETSYLKSKYGNLYQNADGSIEYDSMAQISTPPVFFSTDVLLKPAQEKNLQIWTRFFKDGREIIVSFYRISQKDISKYVYKQVEDQNDLSPATGFQGPKFKFAPISNPQYTQEITQDFILWNSEKLEKHHISLFVKPKIEENSFPVEKASKMLPSGTMIEEVSFSEALGTWIFQEKGNGTWLVKSDFAKKFGKIETTVFERIDESKEKEILFRIPDGWNEDKFKITEGDGMYRIGKFITVKLPDVLEVFRIAGRKNFLCKVHYYFFESWYIDILPQ